MKERWNSDQGNIWIDQEVTLFILGTLVIDFIKWYFVAFVLSGSTDYIYVNGNQVTTGNLHITK